MSAPAITLRSVPFEALPSPRENGMSSPKGKVVSVAEEIFKELQTFLSKETNFPGKITFYPDPELLGRISQVNISLDDLLQLVYLTLPEEKDGVKRSPFRKEDSAFFESSVSASKTASCCLNIGLWLTSILTALPLSGALNVVADWAQASPQNSYALTQGGNANSICLNLTNFFATGICPDKSANANLKMNPLLERSIQRYKTLALSLVSLKATHPELAQCIASNLNIVQRIETAIPRYFSSQVPVIMKEVVERHCEDLHAAQIYIVTGEISSTTPYPIRHLHRLHQVESRLTEGLRNMEEGINGRGKEE